MFRLRASFALALAMLLAPGLTAAATPDSKSAAAQEYAVGKTHFEQGRYADAAAAFEAASKLYPNGLALYSAGLAWEKSGDGARAAEAFEHAQSLGGLSSSEQAQAESTLDRLRSELGQIVVDASASVRVAIDARAPRALPAKFYASSGEHVVSFWDGSAVANVEVVRVARAERLVIAWPRPRPEPPPPPPQAPAKAATSADAPPPPSISRMLGVGALGAGVAAAAAGAIFGVTSLGARDVFDRAPTNDAADHAETLQTLTRVSFVAAGVFLAGGVTLLVWPTHAAEVKADARGLSVRGTF